MKSVIACLIVLLPSLSVLAGPRVDIVIGEKAPALERLAADELASQLKRVYEADVKIGSTAPADSPHIIFVGSPDTNASMKPFAAQWPSGNKKLTDQGHLLRSVTHRDRSALLIGGGSPVATYWAVAEFGHHLGIRSLLFGDLDPISPPPLDLKGFDVFIEPKYRSRGWVFSNHLPTDTVWWSLDDYATTLRQLAKLKFNSITIVAHADHPFVDYGYAGIKRQNAVAPGNGPINVSGDTAGRKAFGGLKEFGNQAFSGAMNYSQRIEAGQRLIRGIINEAQQFGMVASLAIPVAEFPSEFRQTIPDIEKSGDTQGTTFVLGLQNLANDKHRMGLVKAQWQAYLATYPKLNGIEVAWSRDPAYADVLRDLLTDREAMRYSAVANIRIWELQLHDRPLLVSLPLPRQSDSSNRPKRHLHISINEVANGLPTIRPRELAEMWSKLPQLECDGFALHSGFFGDVDASAYWISRASTRESITSEEAYRDLLTSVCGNDVHERVRKAFILADDAATSLKKNSSLVGIPAHLEFEINQHSQEVPAHWSEVRDNYLNAMNEMYRANTRAREGGRAFTLYFARRFEFAFEYMNCIEAVRKAGIAERKKDTATQIAELEKGIESLNNGLNALAAVARSNSDRGLIAVLNEYGYRPLKKKLAAVEAAAK